MMTNEEVTTLAYRTTPKTSKRTTFQDELQAAVTARASKTKPQPYSYSDDFDDEEDDFLNELLKSRKKKIDAFKAGKSKAKLISFDLSDDEDKQSRPKKVSFLKTQRKSFSPNETTASEGQENEPAGSSVDEQAIYNGSLPPQVPTHFSVDNSQFENGGLESADPEITRGYSSLSYLTSDDTLSLPLPSDGSVVNTPGPEENKKMGESSETLQVSSPHANYTNSPDNVTEREPPRPKPRQRTFGLKFQATEKPLEDNESQDLSRPQTSSTSLPLSTATSSNITCADEDAPALYNLSKSSSSKSQQSLLLTKSTLDSGSRDGFITDDGKEPEANYTSTFEEFNESPENQVPRTPEKLLETRTSSLRSKTPERSMFSKKVESKYLGTLKVLDRKVSLQESQLPAADSLRAAVYQEWLQKKKEKSREKMEQQKKKEELLKEEEKKKKEAKMEDAVASYEAWKEKKAESLKEKAKEQKDMVRKEQRETEEKQEKRQSAKQVFEKWKREHDDLLKEKYRKQREAENKLKQHKQEQEDERKRDSTSAFSDWCEKKKHGLHEKLAEERKNIQTKVEEEQYMKEERDKMSLEMYEHWLTRKDLEQKRQKEERRVKSIIQDSPPPPWSPPNKTVPFRK